MTSSVFIFPSLQLTQMPRLEPPALLACCTFAPFGTACDGPGDQAGCSTENCFSFQQAVLSAGVPGSPNPIEKAWWSTAIQRGRSGAGADQDTLMCSSREESPADTAAASPE